MSTDDTITDADVLALLREDEREWYSPRVNRTAPHGNCDYRQREWLRRLALARREARELREIVSGRTMYDAAAVEREACAAICDAAEDGWRRAGTISGDVGYYHHASSARDIAARIRARGQS